MLRVSTWKGVFGGIKGGVGFVSYSIAKPQKHFLYFGDCEGFSWWDYWHLMVFLFGVNFMVYHHIFIYNYVIMLCCLWIQSVCWNFFYHSTVQGETWEQHMHHVWFHIFVLTTLDHSFIGFIQLSGRLYYYHGWYNSINKTTLQTKSSSEKIHYKKARAREGMKKLKL